MNATAVRRIVATSWTPELRTAYAKNPEIVKYLDAYAKTHCARSGFDALGAFRLLFTSVGHAGGRLNTSFSADQAFHFSCVIYDEKGNKIPMRNDKNEIVSYTHHIYPAKDPEELNLKAQDFVATEGSFMGPGFGHGHTDYP